MSNKHVSDGGQHLALLKYRLQAAQGYHLKAICSEQVQNKIKLRPRSYLVCLLQYLHVALYACSCIIELLHAAP